MIIYSSGKSLEFAIEITKAIPEAKIVLDGIAPPEHNGLEVITPPFVSKIEGRGYFLGLRKLMKNINWVESNHKPTHILFLDIFEAADFCRKSRPMCFLPIIPPKKMRSKAIKAINKADLFVPSNYSLYQWQTKFYKLRKKEIQVVFPGLDLEDYEPDFSKRKTILIVCVGKVIKYRNQELMVDIAALSQSDKIHFRLIGDLKDGHYYHHLKRKIQQKRLQNILIIDSNKEIKKNLEKAMIAVFPSASNYFRKDIIRSLSLGVPVVAYRGIGASEIIQDAKNGYLMDDFDPITWYTAILEILNKINDFAKSSIIRAEDFSKESFHKKLRSILLGGI